jgi:hypothetical protein
MVIPKQMTYGTFPSFHAHDDRPQDSYDCATKAEEAGVVDSLGDGTVNSKDLFPSSADQMLPRRLLNLIQQIQQPLLV